MHALTLLAPRDAVEALSDALIDEHDALSVSVEDAQAGSADEEALFGEPGMVPDAAWRRSLLTALFVDEAAAQRAAEAVLGSSDFTGDVEPHSIAEIPDTDWVRATQSQFDPVAITPDFWIVPSWHEPPPQARRTIRLDPGMAFGSGTHPTTQMCLRWLAAHEPELQGRRVIDYGCGSGILAIAAALHGAHSVDAVDIDPLALDASRDNARVNHVTIRVALPDAARGPYDVILANILATPLKLLAPVLADLASTGAHLVLAGVLARQLDELREAYAPFAALHASDENDGWILLTGRIVRGPSHGGVAS